MRNIRVTMVVYAAAFGIAVAAAPAAMAQASDAGASAPGQTSKAQSKAQRKAARKAAHQKRTAELKQAEKNGYKPTGEEANYPANVQGSAGSAKPRPPAPASAP